MSRKREPEPTEDPPKLRGRPPGPPRTAFGQWVQESNLSLPDVVDRMRAEASKVGVRPALIPSAKVLQSVACGRRRPNLQTLALLEHVTEGRITAASFLRAIT